MSVYAHGISVPAECSYIYLHNRLPYNIGLNAAAGLFKGKLVCGLGGGGGNDCRKYACHNYTINSNALL